MSLNTSIGPKVVPPTPPSANVTYDFVDIADGTGTVNFFAAQSIASGAVTQHLLTTDENTASGKVVEKTTNQSEGLLGDINYETTFNLPKLIEGKIRVSFSEGVNGDTDNVRLIMSLWKVSGGVPTQIGSNADSEGYTHSGAGHASFQRLLTITAPRTHFKIGDILRLNVKQYGHMGPHPDSAGYGCDPAGRDDSSVASGGQVIETGETTQLKVAIPFVIDI